MVAATLEPRTLDPQPGQSVTLTVTEFIRHQKGFASREMAGEVLAATPKALLVRGHATIRASDTCLRCGLDIDNPISRLVGYGPICSDKLGIPRPEKLNLRDLDELRRRIEKETVWEGWLPRSHASISSVAGQPKPRQPTILGRTLDHTGSAFILRFPYDPDLVDGVKRGGMEARWLKDHRVWSVPTDHAQRVADYALRHHFSITEAAEAVIAGLNRLLEASSAGTSDFRVEGLGLELYPFQRAGVEYAVQQRRTFIGDQPGLGKTCQALATIHHLSAWPAVVVCPAVVKLNWAREIQRWLPDKSILILEGRGHGKTVRGVWHSLCHDSKARAKGPSVLLVPVLRPLEDARPGQSGTVSAEYTEGTGGPERQTRHEVLAQDGREQPDDRPGRARQDGGHSTSNGTQAIGAGREWSRSDGPADALAGNPGSTMAGRVLGVVQASTARLPDSLHSRPSAARAEAGGGSGRSLAPLTQKPGPEEGRLFGGSGVDGHPSHERRSPSLPPVGPVPDIVILNYDILASWVPDLQSLSPQSFIIDEAHQLKNPAAQRTKAAIALAKHVRAAHGEAAVILCLTGTAVLNRPEELGSQLRIIDRLGEFGGSEAAFKARYRDAGPSRLQELNRKLRSVCYIRREKADVLTDLPPKVRAVVPMELTNRAEYSHARDDLIAYLRAQSVREKAFLDSIRDLPPDQQAEAKRGRADSAEERALRAETLVRINALKRLVARGKLAAVKAWVGDFLDDGDEKLVLFAWHQDIVENLAKHFGCDSITGQTTLPMRQHYVDCFQKDAKKRLLVLNMQAGGVGITLTAASNVAFCELGWTPALHDQAEDRCHRIGQQDSVTAWYLLGADTIDETIASLLDRKRIAVDATLIGTDMEAPQSLLEDLKSALLEVK